MIYIIDIFMPTLDSIACWGEGEGHSRPLRLILNAADKAEDSNLKVKFKANGSILKAKDEAKAPST